MLDDEVLDAIDVHPIIQSSRTARTRKRGKAAAQTGRSRVRWKNLSDEHIRPLGAASEATLPLELCVLSRTVRLQDSAERIVENGGPVAIAALGTATDQDLETTHHRHSEPDWHETGCQSTGS